MKTRLIFDHIPKTAGTSIAAALSEMIGEYGALPDHFNVHFHVIRGAGSRRLFSGHLLFEPGERLARQWYYATLLRDPIDRFLSQYWFYRAVGKQHALDSNFQPHHDPQVQAAANFELEAYMALEDTLIKRSYTNLQASHFARRLVPYPDALSDEALFRAATTSLEDYDMIGIFEDTQGFVDAIADGMGLERVELPRLNITFDRKRSDETPEPLLARLRDSNSVDLKLYEWARGRFANRKRIVPSAEEKASAKLEQQSLSGQKAEESVSDPSLEFGTREVEIRGVRCVGQRGGSDAVVCGEPIQVVVECKALTALDDVTLGIAVRNHHGQLIYGTNTKLVGIDVRITGQGSFVQRYVLQGFLAPGPYYVTVALRRGESHVEGCYHWKENASMFTVTSHDRQRFEGVVDLRLSAQVDAHAA